jgi:hypothetical protein
MCNHDCERCPYPDCIDDDFTEEELAECDKRDSTDKKEYYKKYYHSHTEKFRKYYQDNKEKMNLYHKDYYQEDKEKLKANQREYWRKKYGKKVGYEV